MVLWPTHDGVLLFQWVEVLRRLNFAGLFGVHFFPMDVERTTSHIIAFTSQIIQVLLWNTFFQVWVYLVVFKGKNIWSTDPDSQQGTSDPPPAISLSKRPQVQCWSFHSAEYVYLWCLVDSQVTEKRSDDKTLEKKMWVKISCEPKSGVSEWRLRIYWVLGYQRLFIFTPDPWGIGPIWVIFVFANGLKLQPPAIVLWVFPMFFVWNVATCCWFLRDLQVTTFPFCWMGSHRKTIQSDPRWRPTTANLSQLSTTKIMWRVCEIHFDQRKTWFTPNHFDPLFCEIPFEGFKKNHGFSGRFREKPWQVGFGLWSWQYDRKMAWSSSSKLSLYWQIARKLSYGTDCFFDSVVLSLRWCNSEYIFDKFAVYTHFLWHFPCIFSILFQCFCSFLSCFCCDLHWPAYDLFWMPWSWGLPEILGDDFLDMDLSKELHPRSMVFGYLVCSMCFEM